MIPEKIRKKVKDKCGNDVDARDALIELLKYEDSGKGKQNQKCKEVVEEYASKGDKNEN